MADKEDIVLEKPEDTLNEPRLDESLGEFKGQEGQAPEDEEFASLPEELPRENSDGGFKFTRESAPEESSTFEEVKEDEPTPWYKDRKFMSLVGLSLGIICILVFTLFYLTFNEGKVKPDIIASKPIEQPVVMPDESYNYNDMTRVDGMIQKANALYLKGEVEQALKVYEQIAVYNESLSNYNLGVSQMNEGKFDEAFDSFKKAIANGENQSVAAINAAVCALKLNDKEKFKYYIDLAQVYLPKEGKSKLYDYYLALINYYKGYYPEALQMLQRVNSEPYTDVAKYLSAKIYAKMDFDAKSVQQLNTQGSFEPSLSLGLLYARMGEYDKAKIALNTAMKIERDFNQSLSALTLVDIKTGDFQDMLLRLQDTYRNDEDKYKILDRYKIKVRLNKELFNIAIAQRNFSNDILKKQKDQFDLLFYFAPYQVFDSKQASLYIKKANITNFVDDSSDGQSYLARSQALSSTNVKISNIINDALNQKLRLANKEFQALLEDYPEHSILQYNLALTYAQMQNYELAYKHFSSSYHLNPKNYLAGAFAMFCGKLSDNDTTKLYHEILDNIAADSNFKANMQKNMLFLANGDYISMLPYLDENGQKTPLNLIFETIIAKNNNLNNQVDVRIAKLRSELPQDIVANILYFNSLNSNLNIKEYAQNAQIHFKNLQVDYRSVFGGSNIARELYVNLMHIAGLLNLERQKFKTLINTSKVKDEGMIQTLAYLDIFAQQYEESYALYNTLIDEYGAKDSRTLFLASVAAVGANNPNSAIALLQLSKLTDKNNKESKVALGLLYQEVGNYEAAMTQYRTLPNDFKSEFFTFDIKNQ
ncbi:tetratricopeptide repeat protein [Campylobacter coli]|uniref:Tetratricopeptide repeat protein n=5 Tax=Campylobacter coli TaxID=195 RepID=A0A0Q2JWX1_CAMCO|nr:MULTISPECIES: tetratricopeptide repeat protein [Campylobacter]EAI7420986.1 tetratricopeptide repeat protein [Campylobacter hyointestinalis]EAK5660808.1 tetratricopeptide repeat protein [Campylobacter fetus]EIA56228.1 TPR domain-containing protein [Campylobacter coli 2692]EIA58511.1 TPR domain-containing protein [Campylobacter coli 2698]EIA74251.1 TPR domain-containing protein [Campylobacter coli 1891]EIA77243.1 TPR domain-containing protein [Campylobacter coli 132-6]EIB07548.1 TPR domain-